MIDQTPYWPLGFFTELKNLQETGEYTDQVTPLVQRAAAELVEPLFTDIAGALADDRARTAGFEARLNSRWGRALDLFDVTVEECLQAGSWINTRCRPEAAACQDQKFEAVIRLHGRAIQTAKEIRVLLGSGYSTAAMARWRTIHEIWIVTLLLIDHDQELSQRYLAHEAVESMTAQQWYEESWEALGFTPPDPDDAAEREQLRGDLERRFGKEFLKPYGWAAPLFNDKAPHLMDLAKPAGLTHWRPYYKMASHGVHANPKGITWSLQALHPINAILTGPSNSNLIEPAQCTLIALHGITTCLLVYGLENLMDDDVPDQASALVRAQLARLLNDRAIEVFDTVHKEQQREEDEIRTLVAKASELLNREPHITEDAMAEALNVDADDLSEALQSGVQRGMITVRHQYIPAGRNTNAANETTRPSRHSLK